MKVLVRDLRHLHVSKALPLLERVQRLVVVVVVDMYHSRDLQLCKGEICLKSAKNPERSRGKSLTCKMLHVFLRAPLSVILLDLLRGDTRRLYMYGMGEESSIKLLLSLSFLVSYCFTTIIL